MSCLITKRLYIGGLLTLVCLLAAACNSPEQATNPSSTGGNSPQPFQVAAPTPSPTPSPAATYSVLKNWGNEYQVRSLDFSQLTLNHEYRRLYYERIDGNFYKDVSDIVADYDVRRCIDYLTITGTASEGTITIRGAETGWALDVYDDNCASRNGNYNYTVDANGMHFDGSTYQEVL